MVKKVSNIKKKLKRIRQKGLDGKLLKYIGVFLETQVSSTTLTIGKPYQFPYHMDLSSSIYRRSSSPIASPRFQILSPIEFDHCVIRQLILIYSTEIDLLLNTNRSSNDNSSSSTQQKSICSPTEIDWPSVSLRVIGCNFQGDLLLWAKSIFTYNEF